MSEVGSLTDHVESVSHDLKVLTRPYVRSAISHNTSLNAQWMTLRNLCKDTEYPITGLNSLSCSLETAFGRQVFGMIKAVPDGTRGRVRYGASTEAGLCIKSESLFIHYANLLNPAFQRKGEAKPVIVYDDQSIVGLFKPTERPGILGLADMPDFGLFTGAISELNDHTAQESIIEKVKALDGVARVDIAELFRVGAGMRVLRATTFALDLAIRKRFSECNRASGAPYVGTDDILRRLNNTACTVGMSELNLPE